MKEHKFSKYFNVDIIDTEGSDITFKISKYSLMRLILEKILEIMIHI